MKAQARVLAIDDGPFRKGDPHTLLVGVVTRGASYVEGILTSRVHVDGEDGTRAVVSMIRRSRFRPLLRAILLNGIFVGGFNLVDPEKVFQATGIPVVALVRRAPRAALVRRALAGAFPEGAHRWSRVEGLQPRRLAGTRRWATACGLPPREAARLIDSLCVQGHWPEPLRLAHVVASGVARGESRGRA